MSDKPLAIAALSMLIAITAISEFPQSIEIRLLMLLLSASVLQIASDSHEIEKLEEELTMEKLKRKAKQ